MCIIAVFWLIVTNIYLVTSASKNVSLLVSVPCQASSISNNQPDISCDIYVYAAAVLAGEYVNNKSRGLYKGRDLRRIGVDVNILYDETGVS